MVNKKNIGRPAKVDYKVMGRLEDSLRHGATVSEACDYAGISRDTFYRHLRIEQVFAKKMEAAKDKMLLVTKRSVTRGMINSQLEQSHMLPEKVMVSKLDIKDEENTYEYRNHEL